VSLADHSLTLQLMNQLRDGDQGVLIGVMLPLVHSCASDQHLLFFDPQ